VEDFDWLCEEVILLRDTVIWGVYMSIVEVFWWG
jgi:hypothetical protein